MLHLLVWNPPHHLWPPLPTLDAGPSRLCSVFKFWPFSLTSVWMPAESGFEKFCLGYRIHFQSVALVKSFYLLSLSFPSMETVYYANWWKVSIEDDSNVCKFYQNSQPGTKARSLQIEELFIFMIWGNDSHKILPLMSRSPQTPTKPFGSNSELPNTNLWQRMLWDEVLNDLWLIQNISVSFPKSWIFKILAIFFEY